METIISYTNIMEEYNTLRKRVILLNKERKQLEAKIIEALKESENAELVAPNGMIFRVDEISKKQTAKKSEVIENIVEKTGLDEHVVEELWKTTTITKNKLFCSKRKR